jgi:hypothetical protein
MNNPDHPLTIHHPGYTLLAFVDRLKLVGKTLDLGVDSLKVHESRHLPAQTERCSYGQWQRSDQRAQTRASRVLLIWNSCR